MELLRTKLESCIESLDQVAGAELNFNWLNKFCAALLEFAALVHTSSNEAALDIVCLCLTQILTCIRQLEGTLKVEQDCGKRIRASHAYFVERIRWCLKRLRSVCPASAKDEVEAEEGQSFLDLVDSILDSLALFSSHNEENSCLNVTDFLANPKEILVLNKHLRASVDSLMSHTLGFANVALQDDKKALGALCQKVMRELGAFQEDCQLPSTSACNIKLRAMALEQALYQLEDFINEALLRLVFHCFLDFDKFSVDKIRNILRHDDTIISDEFIADFDVNVDRATQIGVFAMAFAPNLKMKTTVRSCLASFESLDACLIPSLQANGSDIFSEILEQHFNEEMFKFKNALQDIIDSRALVGCFLELLSQGISAAEKNYDKVSLMELNQMAVLLLEHFQIDVNQKVLTETTSQMGKEYFQQFVRMWRECKAILLCADQVEPKRILKRFKILRSTLRKLHGCMSGKQAKTGDDNLIKYQPSVNEGMLELSSILPNQVSILYDTCGRRSRTNRTTAHDPITKAEEKQVDNFKSLKPMAYGSVRRKESLRTLMFKRQNLAESKKLYQSISHQSANLQISDILDQLSNLSTSFSDKQHLLNKH